MLNFLPRPALHNVTKFLTSQDINNLRLVSLHLAYEIPSLIDQYESGALHFSSPDDFQETIFDLENLQRKVNYNYTLPSKTSLQLLYRDYKIKFDGKISFSTDSITLRLECDARGNDDMESMTDLVRYLHTWNIESVLVEMNQNLVPEVLSDIRFPRLKSLAVKLSTPRKCGFCVLDLKSYLKNTTSLLNRISGQLESLILDDSTRLGKLLIVQNLPNLTYLHLENLTHENLEILECAAPSLVFLSVVNVDLVREQTVKFPNMKAIRSYDPGVLYLLSSCCATLECLVITYFRGYIENNAAMKIVKNYHLPNIKHLSLPSQEWCKLMLKKYRRSLETVRVQDYKFDDRFLFPMLKDLTYLDLKSSVSNIKHIPLPSLQVLRMYAPLDEILKTIPDQIPHMSRLQKIVVLTSDKDAASQLSSRFECQVEVDLPVNENLYGEKMFNSYRRQLQLSSA